MTPPASVRLRVSNLTKHYPGTVALDGVTLDFTAGQVHAVLGKNGAGKSTLIRIISGATEPTSGEIVLEGAAVAFSSPRDAMQAGIATVHQEMALIPAATVAENIVFGRLPRRSGPLSFAIDWKAVFSEARQVLDELGITLDVRRPVAELGIAQQQLVEIAKAFARRPTVLLLDEPTSALAAREVQALFRTVRRLTERGVAVIYVSHRLQELPQIADTISVLRDGRLVGTIPIAAGTPSVLADMMFGRVARRERPEGLTVHPEVVLRVDNLSRAGRFHDVTFDLRRGEILGLAGMLGSGRTSILMSLFGAEPLDTGTITVAGRPLERPSPSAAKAAGLGLVPENRAAQGLVLGATVRDNLTLAGLSRMARGGWIDTHRRDTTCAAAVRDLDIRAPTLDTRVESLSGGNQQKVVIGNWLNTEPRVMLFDEPTRGIDLQAKGQIFRIIWDLARRGTSIIVVSSELEELLELCHRVLVIRSGTIVGEVDPIDTDMARLLALCMGTA